MIPHGAIIPVLIAAFLISAVDHYRLNPARPVRNIRFAMMASAVIMVFVALASDLLAPWVTQVLFAFSWFWLAAAGLLLWRRETTT